VTHDQESLVSNVVIAFRAYAHVHAYTRETPPIPLVLSEESAVF
jgi:hypothetical protein